MRKVKIKDIKYENDDLIVLYIEDIEESKKTKWALKGASFDNLINNITGKNLNFSIEQRKDLCKKIIGIEFIHNPQMDEYNMETSANIIKNYNNDELKRWDDSFDSYPFKELYNSMEQEGED